MTLIGAILKAYRLLAITLVLILLSVVAIVTTARTVGVAGVPVRASWFLSLAVVGLCAVPLRGVWPSISGGFVRDTAIRLIRSGWHTTVSATFAVLLATQTGDRALLVWFVALQALSLTLAAIVEEAALIATLGVGVATIAVDNLVPGLPISTLMARFTIIGPVVMYGAAAVLFIIHRRGSVRSD
ncbi:MAG: hypothetical protein ACK5MP_07420 [Nostocoides sp.]